MTPMDAIGRIEEHIQVPLIPELRILYAQSDGERALEYTAEERLQFWATGATVEERQPADARLPSSAGRPMRFMTSDEVIKTFDTFRALDPAAAYGPSIPSRTSVAFWTGLNGDYAFVFLAGPLIGHVYYWQYDGRYTSVAYRNVSAFLDAMNVAAMNGLDWYQAPTDFFIPIDYYYHGEGICRPATPNDYVRDLSVRQDLAAELDSIPAQDECRQQDFAFNYMALTPPERTGEIVPFLDSPDMWIQERACLVLGHRNYEQAIEKLAMVARSGMPNGRSAAIRVLKKMKSATALQFASEIESETAQRRGKNQ